MPQCLCTECGRTAVNTIEIYWIYYARRQRRFARKHARCRVVIVPVVNCTRLYRVLFLPVKHETNFIGYGRILCCSVRHRRSVDGNIGNVPVNSVTPPSPTPILLYARAQCCTRAFCITAGPRSRYYNAKNQSLLPPNALMSAVLSHFTKRHKPSDIHRHINTK